MNGLQPDYTVTMDLLFDGVLLPGDDILYMTETIDNTTCGVGKKHHIGMCLKYLVWYLFCCSQSQKVTSDSVSSAVPPLNCGRRSRST